jgi:hypothetical protein
MSSVNEEEQLLTNFVNVSAEPEGACEPNLEAEDKDDWVMKYDAGII